MPVRLALSRAVSARGNDGLGAGGFNRFDQGVAVVPLVGNNRSSWNGIDQCSTLRDVRFLTAGQDQAQRVAEGINADMDLGGQSASRAADRLIATVFLSAPAEC